jgi:hypothetical protein
MKFHEPEWIGETVQCYKCRVEFTLEADDEELVTFKYETIGVWLNYSMRCPKCNAELDFAVDVDKKQKTTLQKKEVFTAEEKPQPVKNEVQPRRVQRQPASIEAQPRKKQTEPINVQSRPVDGEMDVRALRRLLLNNND